LFAEVDVHELADFADADVRAGVAAAEDDREAVIRDETTARDIAQYRVRRVGRCLFRLGELQLSEASVRRDARQVALGGRLVVDPWCGRSSLK